ncbi:MAG: molybdopterin cofactor-binding domain-containing protein [Steroidobacteraceae bacterium]
MGGGLLVGFGPELGELESRLVHARALGDPGWIRISSDGSVRLLCSRSEMGQGVWSALAQIVNEELEADPAKIRVEVAPIWRAYSRPMGFFTGGSTSVESMFTPMRSIGAAARMMLIEAAASRWGVDVTDCRASRGFVIHPASGHRAGYGELAAAAARLRPPADPPLKPRAAWSSIGQPLARLGARSKVNGSARYGLDVRLPEMLMAAVSQSPWPGTRLESLDEQAALRQPGVVRVVALEDTVGVLAKNYWSAWRGLQSAALKWRAPDHAPDTEELRSELHRRVESSSHEPGQSHSRVVRATYEVPLLMHAQLEPLNATARVHRLGAEIWAPTQAPHVMQLKIARALLLLPPAVSVHATRIGGGFGRRLFTDEGVAAARIAREAGVAVKAIWPREEDSVQDRFRPMAVARLESSLDATGAPDNLSVRIASLGDQPRTAGLDPTPYRLEGSRVEYLGVSSPIRVGFWRSVDASQNVFFRESFLDECAHAAGADPLEYRLRLLGSDRPRGQRVLSVLAESSGWKGSRAANRSLGLAYHEGFGSISAQAVEISVNGSGAVHIERIVVVVDCGTAVNPANIRAQLEGGTLFALSAALREEVIFERGRQLQRNFDTYSVLRLADAPAIEVKVLETPDAPIGGMGEVGVPPLAPALANALFAATGIRVRRLPLAHADIRWI